MKFVQFLKSQLVPMLLIAGSVGALSVASVTPVSAGEPSRSPTANAVNDGVSGVGGRAGGGLNLQQGLTRVINILLFLIGTIAIIMIIVGGLRYVLSNGDSSAISGAKNTVLYAVIGLVVAVLAYAIINFVLDAF